MGLISKDGCNFVINNKLIKLTFSLGEIISVLTRLHDDGLGYSVINTAKSMLPALFEMHRKEILIKRFMKGIFHLRPFIPKTNITWNVKTVLKWLETLNNQQP